MADQSSADLLRELWKIYCSNWAKADIDLPQFVHAAAKSKRDSLSKWACEGDFDELCSDGRSEVSLAFALWVIELSRRWGSVWKTAAGSKRQRDQLRSILEKAASALEDFQNALGAAVFEDVKRSLSLEHQALTYADIKSFKIDPESVWPASMPAPHPETMIKALRSYSRFLLIFEAIPEESGIHTPESLSKYLISAYVKKATGDFHDPQVSALIGSALEETYDETAHRMWRSRNYDQIEKTSSTLAELLLGIGTVISGEV